MSVTSYKCPNCGGALVYNARQKRFLCDHCLSSFTDNEMNKILEENKSEETIEIKPTESLEEIQKQIDSFNQDIGISISNEKENLNIKENKDEKEMEEENIVPPLIVFDENKDIVENINNYEKEIDNKQTNHEQINKDKNLEKIVVYRCPSCGAEIITDKNTAATFCYYCQSSIIVSNKIDGKYLPDYVIPFEIEKQKAKEILLKWIQSKKYIPKDFYNEEHIEKLTGVYFPYFLYNCDVNGNIEANGEKTRSWYTGNTRYTEYKKFKVIRSGKLKINKMTRGAIKNGNKEIIEGVLPYNITKFVPFNAGYLSGYFAQKRDMDYNIYKKDAEAEAKNLLTQKLVSRTGNYNSVELIEGSLTVENEKWEYALLPVWVMTYKKEENGEIYYFAINGQNGKIYGKLPISKSKLITLFAKTYILTSSILLIGGWFI